MRGQWVLNRSLWDMPGQLLSRPVWPAMLDAPHLLSPVFVSVSFQNPQPQPSDWRLPGTAAP